MKNDPRSWFAIEAELWQPPGTLKLKDWQRRIAIYLRKCSGVDDGDETRPLLVLRSNDRIAADTGLSLNKVEKTINRLRCWPTPNDPFIREHNGSEITLRPLPTKFVRCPVWLWESPLPEDLKDVFLFIRSRFRGKTPQGEELFTCSLWGRKQPSIERCCYVKGKRKGRPGREGHTPRKSQEDSEHPDSDRNIPRPQAGDQGEGHGGRDPCRQTI